VSLIGRDRELHAVNAVVTSALEAKGSALVIRGEAGIGKSAILAAAEALARDQAMRIVAIKCVPPEANLAFAGLHHLLHPLLERRKRLPEPQRRALDVAFGLAAGPAPNTFLVGLATLSVLVETGSPVLVSVDDAQWLDHASCDALIFAARRIAADPIAMLATLRDRVESAFDESGLPEIRLERLDPGSAKELLASGAPDLGSDVAARVLEEAAGNPLALIELPVAIRDGDARDLDGNSARLPLTKRLERAFAAQAAELPAVTRQMLLVAATDERATAPELAAATARLANTTVAEDTLAPAIAAKLIDVDGGLVRFRHPLVPYAIYQAATVFERRATHAALAEVLTDPDRRVWHRAASSLGPDESIAIDLEAMADRAGRRGAIVAAINALEKAAQVSGDQGRRGARLLTAAELALQLGRHEVLLRLLGEAESIELSPADRPRLAWLREWYGEGAWSGAERVAPFVRIADEMTREGDPERALRSLLTVALRSYWSNPDATTRELIIAAAERIDAPPLQPELIAVLAFAAPLERGAVVLDRLDAIRPDSIDDPEKLRLLGMAATAVGAWDRAAPFLQAAIPGLRAEGRLGLVSYAQVSLGMAGLFTGNWANARSAAEEAIRLNREASRPTWLAAALAAAAGLDGLRGDGDSAETLAADAEALLLPIGAHPMLALVQAARGLTGLGAGRPDVAFEHFRRIFDRDDIAFHRYVRHWVVGDFVDASMRTGHEREARSVVAQLEPDLAQTRSPLLRVNLAFALALLAPEQEAEQRFQVALAEDLARWPFVRARVLLAYGEWLRRHRQASASRRPLRVAREAFDALGAAWWGGQARTELRASGETSQRRAAGAVDQLTPQEVQVARMAAEGLSNREIGDQLYLSHRTIAFHLHQIYAKLEITSRAQLHLFLQDEPVSA
jgi:DNA-binding CsgD family transcriptional regulator/tetratricopeptide (TPR) repeat protein